MFGWDFRIAGLAAALAVAAAGVQTARLARADNLVAYKTRELHKAATALHIAGAEIASRDKLLAETGRAEASDAGAAASFWKGQCREAFKAGRASMRCDGPGDDGVVRDLRAIQSAGAFVPHATAAGEPLR